MEILGTFSVILVSCASSPILPESYTKVTQHNTNRFNAHNATPGIVYIFKYEGNKLDDSGRIEASPGVNA